MAEALTVIAARQRRAVSRWARSDQQIGSSGTIHETLRARCKPIRRGRPPAWFAAHVDDEQRAADIERLASREIYQSPWLRLREDDIDFADGTRGTYAVVEKQDFVVVLPFSDDGYWLVQQYPVPDRQPAVGVPAGRLAARPVAGRSRRWPEPSLPRRPGCGLGTLTHLGRMFAAYGYSSQSFDVFRATELSAGAPRREISEQDMVHRWFAAGDVGRWWPPGSSPTRTASRP